jgi:hypothetical protein
MENISTEQAGQMNFTLPHDVVTLPTGGIFYKSKKKSVKIGYLTAADENTLISIISSNTTTTQLIMNLIRGKLYENDIKPDELLEGDIEAILIFLRNTSFGPEYNVSVNDPATNKTFSTTIILDEINIKKTQSSPDSNGYFTTTLPRTNVNVRLKPLSYGEIIELEKMVESYPQGRTVPRITWRLNKLIVDIDGNTDRNFISQFVETMPIMDSKHIRKFMSDNEPRLDLNREVIAPSGEKVNVDINFGVEFFRPFF